jgi:hypothetical protein
MQQYKANVVVDEIFKQTIKSEKAIPQKQSSSDLLGGKNSGSISLLSSDDLIAEIDKMDPLEREIFMDELAIRSNFWNEEDKVLYG